MLKRNDNDRRIWVLNWEPLYLSWRSSGLGMRRYIQIQRAAIDRVIDEQINRKPVAYIEDNNEGRVRIHRR